MKQGPAGSGLWERVSVVLRVPRSPWRVARDAALPSSCSRSQRGAGARGLQGAVLRVMLPVQRSAVVKKFSALKDLEVT